MAFLEALKERLKKANENFAPKDEREAREMAMGMIGGTVSPGKAKFAGVVGNPNKLLRVAEKAKYKGKFYSDLVGGGKRLAENIFKKK